MFVDHQDEKLKLLKTKNSNDEKEMYRTTRTKNGIFHSENNLTMKKRCKLKRKTTIIVETERENFKDAKEMESSKNDQKSEKEKTRKTLVEAEMKRVKTESY